MLVSVQESTDVAVVGPEAALSPGRATLYPVQLSQLGASIRNESASALAPAAATAPGVSQARPLLVLPCNCELGDGSQYLSSDLTVCVVPSMAHHMRGPCTPP